MMKQEDFFNEYYEGLQQYRWVGVKDLSEMFGVSERTVFKWLEKKHIKGCLWKGKRLVDTVSVMGYLLEKKCLEINQIKQREIREKIQLEEFMKKGDELF